MSFLLDQGAGRSAAELLRAAGFSASHVREHGLSVTFDHDFHEQLALSGARAPSVIFVRDEHLKSPALAELVAALCKRHESALRAGAAVTVRRRLARIRLLPLRIEAT